MPSTHNTNISPPDKMQIIITSTILLSLLHPIGTSIYLLDTHDGSNIEHFDCLYIDSLPYCRRPRFPIDLTRNAEHFSCNETNGGILHRFSNLRANNVSISTILHRWRSSIEQVEAYARFLREKTGSDGHLCECQHGSGFGKSCEYQLPVGTALEETLNWQLMMRQRNEWKVQVYGKITCYEGISCDSGLLCLDWREICDGTQNCMFGLDEDNCDILEMNICDDDEYRCSNGMCIPEQYFVDGEFDCSDGSDEKWASPTAECGWKRASVRCDDRICLRNQWSCGDGQCIWLRLHFQTDFHQHTCGNRRDQYFMCETHYKTLMWTMPNGRCNGDENYVANPLIEPAEEENCEYLLRCALSRGGEKNCPCQRGGDECRKELTKRCPNKIIQYPKGAFMAPFLFFFFFYNTSQQDTGHSPHYILINGTVKCRHTLVNVTTKISYAPYRSINVIIDSGVCIENNSYDPAQWNQSANRCFRANESSDVCRGWNPCLSVTRIKDGWYDCWDRRDEKNQTNEDIEKGCARVQRHRFRCSPHQPTCLHLAAFGDGVDNCENRYDEVWARTNRKLFDVKCDEEAKDDCSLLRQYIEQSRSPSQKNDSQTMVRMPFRSYCDTFRDLKSGEDENRVECQRWWRCTRTQRRCETGQCIDEKWVDDGEWDCTDALDERQLLQFITWWTQRQASIQQSSSGVTWDMNKCHSTSTFICLSPHSTQRQFICLNHTQLSDNKIDCLGAIDERHILPHCSTSSELLGHHFLCPSTNHCVPFWQHCRDTYRCPNRSDDDQWCSRSTSTPTASSCSERTDFVCFDGTCIFNGRCNELLQCPFGEDEYMCDYRSVMNGATVLYRMQKGYNARRTIHTIQVPDFPNQLTTVQQNVNKIILPLPSATPLVTNSFSLTPYRCNRGLAILSANNRSIVCSCPPQYYGDFCEYHADRLLLLLHLNLSQAIYTPNTDLSIVIKLLVLFLFDDQVLMTHEFYLRPAWEITTFAKKTVHLPYSRSPTFRQHRRDRFNNRSDILHSQPFSIRIEAFEMDGNKRLALMAVWHYPIVFDYLPVFRFAKVLHWTKMDRRTRDPCSTRRCPPNSRCHPLMNDHSQSICLCKAGFSGENCTVRDEQCARGHCAPSSLCMPSYRSLLRGNVTPYCICPSNRFGDRCEIVHDYCQLTPCLHGGTCHPTSQPNRVICVCPSEYRGSYCETMKPHVRLSLIERIQYAGAVVQYFHIDFVRLNLLLVYQQAYRTQLPRSIQYHHDGSTAPPIVVAKIYDSHDASSPHLYLLSVALNAIVINGTTQMSDVNRCDAVHTISNVSSPIQYHRICRENNQTVCFRDDTYLCICGTNHTRVECFLYDDQLDRCSHCLSGGRCLRGDHNQLSAFVCLCPPCHSGRRCQFNSRPFAFTLDQLLFNDLTSTRRTRTILWLMILSCLGLLVSIPNNLFSFATFRRRVCLRSGVGHYLLCLGVVNQINLSLFLVRLIHLISNTIDGSVPSLIDTILCRSLNFFIDSSGRLVYWLSSLIAIERTYMTVALNGQWFKDPRTARRLILLTVIGVLLCHCHELIFYKAFYDPDEARGSICVFQYPVHSKSLWPRFHLAITVINILVPFVINLCATIIISLIVVGNKMNTLQKDTAHRSWWRNVRRRSRLAFDVLRENRELVIGPAITLIPQSFSLPFLISGFALNCESLEESSFRYLLIASYWTTLTPQWSSFFLYISPSSFYSSEWRKTKIARWIYTRFQWHPPTPTMTFTVLSKSTQEKL